MSAQLARLSSEHNTIAHVCLSGWRGAVMALEVSESFQFSLAPSPALIAPSRLPDRCFRSRTALASLKFPSSLPSALISSCETTARSPVGIGILRFVTYRFWLCFAAGGRSGVVVIWSTNHQSTFSLYPCVACIVMTFVYSQALHFQIMVGTK